MLGYNRSVVALYFNYRRLRALVVEDDRQVGRLLTSTLHSLGFEVDELECGDAALTAIQDESKASFDLYCFDLALPIRSGFELCAKAREYSPNSTVVIISGRTSLEDHARSIECGADFFIEKPFRLDFFKAEIQRVFKARLQSSEGSGSPSGAQPLPQHG